MAAQKLGGTATFLVDGLPVSIAGTMTIMPDNIDREGQAGLSGVAGYTETNVTPFIEIEAYTTAGLDVQAIAALTDVTVFVLLGNGRSYVANNAWAAGTREINAADGTVPLRFEACEIQQL